MAALANCTASVDRTLRVTSDHVLSVRLVDFSPAAEVLLSAIHKLGTFVARDDPLGIEISAEFAKLHCRLS